MKTESGPMEFLSKLRNIIKTFVISYIQARKVTLRDIIILAYTTEKIVEIFSHFYVR